MGGWITKVIAVPTKSGDEVATVPVPEHKPTPSAIMMLSHITRMIKFVSGRSSCGVEVVPIKSRNSINIKKK